jgi:hypothetical protein
MERLSADVLVASSSACAAFCAMLCGLTLEDYAALLRRGKARFAQELAARGPLSAAESAHLLKAYQAAARDGQRFFPGQAAAAAVAEAAVSQLATLADAFPATPDTGAAKAEGRVPVRQFVMPMDSLEQAARIAGQTEAFRAYEGGPRKTMREAHMAEAIAAYYMDGVRTLGEIIALTELDIGGPLPELPGYIDLLAAIGAVRFA